MTGYPPGRRIGLPCPMPTCPGEIVYNGNYFCDRFTWLHEDGCDWALSHNDTNGEPIGLRDRNVWRKIQESTWSKQATNKESDDGHDA